jgi:hypothetical protein
LLDALFGTMLMVANEQSLMEAVTTFKPERVVVDLSLPGEGEGACGFHIQGKGKAE